MTEILIKPHKQLVEVHNLDDEPYIEDFKEELIKIPAKGHIKMKRRKAVAFLASFPPNYEKGLPNEGKLRRKMLEIRKLGGDGPPVINQKSLEPEYICHLDGTKFDTKEELDRYLKRHADKVVKTKTQDEKINCPICDTIIEGNKLFMEHLVIHKENRKKEHKIIKTGNK